MFRKCVVALAATLLSSTAAHADWYRATSKHFVVYSNDSLADVKDYTTRLEQFDQGIRAWHLAPQDKRGASARVTVFVLDDISAIAQLAGRTGVAGFYSPHAGESVAFTPRSGDSDLGARAILFHEYTHHWMLTNWTDAALPPWFVEGFAELHATAFFRGDQIIFGAVPAYRRYTVGQMNLLPISRLLKFDPGNLSPIETDALYSHGWALTHYLTFDEAGRKRLAAYVDALNGGSADDPAKLIGDGNIDLKLNQYVRRPRLPSAAFDLAKLPVGSIEVSKLDPAEAAMMPALMQSKRGVGRKNAEQTAALARRLAAPYPDNSFAQNELAEAEYDACSVVDAAADCYSRSAAAADRAIAANPKSVHALVYRGMADIAALKKAKVQDPARWAAARQWFLRANKVDTEMPQPLIQYYDSFVDAGETPTVNAQSALLYAYALAPYDSDLRLQAAGVYLRQGKADEARTAIKPVAYNIDQRAKSEYAKRILAALDKDGTAAAVKEMDAKPTPKDEDDG